MPISVITENTAAANGVTADNVYSGAEDIYIHEESPGFERDGETTLGIGGITDEIQKPIFRFTGLSNIPPGDTVNSAVLHFRTGFGFGSVTANAFAMLRPWVRTQVQWLNYATSTPWEASGAAGAADRQLVAANATPVTVNGSNGWFTVEVTSIVADMVAGTLTEPSILVEPSAGDFWQVLKYTGTDGERAQLVVDHSAGGGGGNTLDAETVAFSYAGQDAELSIASSTTQTVTYDGNLPDYPTTESFHELYFVSTESSEGAGDGVSASAGDIFTITFDTTAMNNAVTFENDTTFDVSPSQVISGIFTVEDVSASTTSAPIAFSISRFVAADTGAFTSLNQDAGLLLSLSLTAESAGYNFAGLDADLRAAISLPADSVSFSLSGTDADLLLSSVNILVAESGGLSFAGSDAVLITEGSLVAESGGYTYLGDDAALSVGRSLDADAGVLALTGADAALTFEQPGAFAIAADAGAFSLIGPDANLRYVGPLAANNASYAYQGPDASLNYSETIIEIPIYADYVIPSSSVSLTLSSNAATNF